MTLDKYAVMEEYVAACIREGKMLSSSDIDRGDAVDFSTAPVYTHFGGIGDLRIAALV